MTDQSSGWPQEPSQQPQQSAQEASQQQAGQAGSSSVYRSDPTTAQRASFSPRPIEQYPNPEPVPPPERQPAVDLLRFWSAALITAVVAGLVAVIIVRLAGDVFDTPLVVPTHAGSEILEPLSDSRAFWTAFVAAIVAAGILNLMVYVVPSPTVFWALLVVAATGASIMFPLSQDLPTEDYVWLIVLHATVGFVILVLGSAISSLTAREP